MTTFPPMVSCLMVTRGRPELVRQAVACFAWQSYRARELVVVAEPGGVAAVEAAAGTGVPGLRVLAAPRPEMPLGELRNLALDAARGELVAQWDDDDLYHPCRVAAQVAALGGGAVASFFTSQLQYFAAGRELFVTDWRRRGRPTLLEPVPDCIPGTALFRRSLGLRYPHIRVKDDAVMLEQLELRGEVARISDAPHLYMYRHHGANTFAEDHWRWITRWSASARELRRLRIPVTLALQHFAPFLGPGRVRVRSRSGATAYTLSPAPRPLPAAAPAPAAAAPAATPHDAPAAPPLRLSVAIATWNRADLLRETLLALTAAAPPHDVDVEVLVCDNRSTDSTAEVAAAAAADLPLRCLREEKEGKSWALLRLLGEAAGEWVLFLDDDVLADPGLIAAYTDGIRRYPRAACLGGQVLPWLDEPARGVRAALLARYPWMHSVVSFDRDETISPAELRFVHGPNLAVRRDAVVADDVDTRRGMFGRTRISGEDLAIVERVMARGHEGWRLAGAVVHHFVPRARSGSAWFVQRHLGEARSRAVGEGREPGSLRYRLRIVSALAPALVGPALRRYDRLQWAIRWRTRGVLSAAWRRLRRTSS